MKLSFKPAPHYRSPQSTTSIMRDVTACLLAVLVFAVVYYTVAYGVNMGLRVVLLALTAVVAACATEAIWFKATKQDVMEGLKSSYGWITALILTLISSINVSYYALAVSTIMAILFGKLVFGGFGQNIFNPAAFGEAILMSFFAGSNADLLSGATPTVALNKYNWLGSADQIAKTIGSYGGFGKMLVGGYASTIGSTAAILLILCLIFLIYFKDIDWQAPIFYIGTVFVLTTVIGLIRGAGMSYGLVHVLAGGVLFGGVFMLTDPVTSPVSIPGRILFAVGAAVLTVIIRLGSNMSDGVLYSILLMNMLTPAIDKLMDGNQIKNASKIRRVLGIGCCATLLVGLLVGAFIHSSNETNQSSTPSATTTTTTTTASSGSGAYAEYEATASEVSNDGSTAVYHVVAKGFGLLDPNGEASKYGGHEYKENEADITIDLTNHTVSKVELTVFGDTEGVGTMATSDDVLSGYVGKKLGDDYDLVSGATYTSQSIAAMVEAALEAAGQ